MENKKLIITIGREQGSGGRKIANLLAEHFTCEVYDKEILNLAAQESGFSPRFFEQNDEKKKFFKSLFHLHIPYVSDGNFYNNDFSQENLFLFQSDAIRKAASKNNCIFVGRCADYVLRDYPNVVNIFITAGISDRVARMMKRLGCNEKKALDAINESDESRASYYNYYTGKKWGQCSSYDLCVNSSLLGIEGTTQQIIDFIEKKLNTEQ
ncbi:MAG: cytidylate kinase-like family protein [Prevotella sp.]|nr:cytidylate kinase-like family protein [Prevotella sp.]MDY3852201.1 cytidylate kinase-like family protein [Prevotella sp.]